MGTILCLLIGFGVFPLLFWVIGKLLNWGEKKNDNGFGCFVVMMIIIILFNLLALFSFLMSDDSDSGTTYDYYEDRAR